MKARKEHCCNCRSVNFLRFLTQYFSEDNVCSVSRVCSGCMQKIYPSTHVMKLVGMIEGSTIFWSYLLGRIYLHWNAEVTYVSGIVSLFVIIMGSMTINAFVRAFVLYYCKWVPMKNELESTVHENSLQQCRQTYYRCTFAASLIVILYMGINLHNW